VWKDIAMDLKIAPLSSQGLSPLGQLKRPTAASGAAGAGAGGVGGDFANNFKSALQSVSAAQANANRLQAETHMGNPQVSLEETMVAMQKAQIGFQAALHVRNRMVSAYTDIMNMSV